MVREYNELVGARLLYSEVAGCLSRHLELINIMTESILCVADSIDHVSIWNSGSDVEGCHIYLAPNHLTDAWLASGSAGLSLSTPAEDMTGHHSAKRWKDRFRGAC